MVRGKSVAWHGRVFSVALAKEDGLRRVVREMEVFSYSTVSSVCAMLRRGLNRDQKLKKRLEGIHRLLIDH